MTLQQMYAIEPGLKLIAWAAKQSPPSTAEGQSKRIKQAIQTAEKLIGLQARTAALRNIDDYLTYVNHITALVEGRESKV